MKITPTFINFNKHPGSVETVTKDLTKYLYAYILPELEEKLEGIVEEISISIEKTKKGISVIFSTRYKNKTIIIKENGSDFYYIVPKTTKIFIKKVLKYRDKFMDTKKQKRVRNKMSIKEIAGIEDEIQDSEVNKDDYFGIRKVKHFQLTPIMQEEAILQMELLGHDFFLYLDVDTEEIRVVYKRKDGTYGMIKVNS